MKRIIYFCGLICLLLVVIVYSRNINFKNIGTTDLSSISCDGIHILDDFEHNNNYTPSDEFLEKENRIYYEECFFEIDENNLITLIHANFSDTDILINSNTNCKTVDDVIKTLGANYSSSWYDREQQLKQVVYVDHENNIKATFVYNTYENKLTWLILKKIY